MTDSVSYKVKGGRSEAGYQMGLFKGFLVTIWNSTKIFVYIPERVLQHPKYVSFQGLDKTTSSGPY